MGYAMCKFLIVKIRIKTFAAYAMKDLYHVNFIYQSRKNLYLKPELCQT